MKKRAFPSFLRASRRASFLLALVMGLTVLSPKKAHGADETEVLIRKGLQLRKEGRDREALPLFQDAVARARLPRSVAQLGACEQALGLWPLAEQHLEEALRADNDPWIKKNAPLLRDSLSSVRNNVAHLEIWGSPEGASVTIDDAAVGKLPLAEPVHLSEGRRVVTVEAPGYVPETRTVMVKAGALMREHVTLAKMGERLAAASPGPVAPLPLVQPAQNVHEAEGITPESSSPFYKSWWFWTLAGVVVVGAGAATVYYAKRSTGCTSEPGKPCW